MPTYEAICDYHRSYDFSLEKNGCCLAIYDQQTQQASLALVNKTNVKSVETKSSHQKHKGGQHSHSYCLGNHKPVDCTKYKTINARKDQIVAQCLCFNCLGVGHSSKSCKSNRTCHICHQHHHTSLCHQQSNNSNSSSSSSKGSDSTSNTKGQTSQARSSSHTPTQSHPYPPQQQQQKPVVTQGKNNNTPKTPSSSSQSTSVTNVNLAQTSSLTSNVLPTATLDLRYFSQKLNTRAFFDTGSQRSFVTPEIVRRLNLPVLEKVPIQLATFGNDSTSCILDLVKIKIQFGNHRFTVKLLVHDQASMESNCPVIYEVSQQLEQNGYCLASHHISSDTLTGIEVLVGVDYFSCFISCQRRAKGMNLFVTRNRGIISFGLLPKWATQQQSYMQFRCVRILCGSESDVSQIWKLESIAISKEELSPSERETISKVSSNIQKSESGYIVHLPFKSNAGPSTSYRTTRGQLNSLAQRIAQDEKLYGDYNGVVDDYITKDFIEEIPNEPIAGHYMPYHPVYKKSATTPIRIVVNASSKPTGGKSLKDCLLTGPTLTAKLHNILLTFQGGKYAVTADISKAFHRVIADERDRDYLRFCGLIEINLNFVRFALK